MSIDTLKTRAPFRAQVLDTQIQDNFSAKGDVTNAVTIIIRPENEKREPICAINQPLWMKP